MAIRKALAEDIAAVAGIYDRIHTAEERGDATPGWVRGVYPTEQTAKDALLRGDLFVFTEGADVVGTAIINQIQPDCYCAGDWEHMVPESEIMVLHTLVIDPNLAGRSYGTQFVKFYEEYAAAQGCPYLRLDTQIINSRARAFYQKMGYREVGIVPCEFNGIMGVQLVLLEKKL